MQHEASLNHDFILSVLIEAGISGRVLDFGCGTGAFVAKARASGFDCQGADTYADIWSGWRDAILPGAREAVALIENGRLPFEDATFAAVVSNQVFEHVAPRLLPGVIDEIRRVLAPGGLFLLLYPHREVWYEAHLGLYGVHRLPDAALRPFLRFAHRFGIGFKSSDLPRDAWVAGSERVLNEDVFYHPAREVRDAVSSAMGARPKSLGAEYVRHRLHHAGMGAGLSRSSILEPLLAFVAAKRAGVIDLYRKSL